MDHDDTVLRPEPAPMPAALDVRAGVENQRQKAQVLAALFGDTPAPIKIGRFTIVRELGAGGMGIVYVAYDEQLDRRVAVKLLRTAADIDEEAQRRLQREAQAMARLSHPNVVIVHEVGTFEGQVFVAMEFVEGRDLRGWLEAEPRTWEAVLDVFRQAGEGLATAHEAGIIHRDFKPDNVLVGEDGRVRVADFGLAHGRGARPQHEASPSESSHSSAQLELRLTATGAVMGTPAYMAPEQFEGAATDERSDQFSFCVAMWEGLYGERPFSASNMVAQAAAVSKGRLPDAPVDTEVPSWLRAIVARGLTVEPAQRWPSMRALLVALASDPQARRRRLVVRGTLGALAVAAVAAISGLGWLASEAAIENGRQRYWAGFEAELDAIDDQHRTELDAERSRDGARLDAVARHQPLLASEIREDPTATVALLREVEGEARATSRWVSAANNALLEPIALDVLSGHKDVIVGLAFGPDGALYSASRDKTVRRWFGDGDAVLYGHEEGVTSLALGPDGRTLATGSADDRVGVWRPGSGVEWLVGHSDDIEVVAFSPDGLRVASGSRDKSARIWPAVEGGGPVVLDGHDKRVLGLAFSPDGEAIVTGSADHTARVWDAGSGELRAVLRGHEQPVYHVRFVGPDRVLTASDDGTARLWTPDEGGRSVVLVRHDKAITSVHSVDGEHFVSTSNDRTARLWRAPPPGEAPAAPVILRGHSDRVWQGLYTPERRSVVTVSFDGTIRVSAPEADAAPTVLTGHNTWLARAAIDTSGRWLATGDWDGTLRVWDLDRGPGRVVLRGHEHSVQRVVFDGAGERVASVSDDGDARVWRSSDGMLLATLAGDAPVSAAAFSPDGAHLATGSVIGQVRLWDGPGYERRELGEIGEWVWSLAFEPHGERLATSSFEGSLWIWDPRSAASLRAAAPETQGRGVSRVVFSPNADRVFSVARDGILRTWTPDGEPLGARRAHDDVILALALSPDGRTVATSSSDGSAKLWPAAGDGAPIVLLGHAMAVQALSFSPDGTKLATGSLDRSVKVWDARTGRALAEFTSHGGEVWDLVFGRSGREVLSASEDGLVRLWSLDGRPEIVLRGHDGPVLDLALSPDGTQLASASVDTRVILWRLDPLSADPSVLVERLDRATHHCLDPRTRVEEIGEELATAEREAQACRARDSGRPYTGRTASGSL